MKEILESTLTLIINTSQEVLLAPLAPTNRIWLPFLMTGYTIAVLYYFFLTTDENSLLRKVRVAIQKCFPKSVYLDPSAVLDYKYFLFNGILYTAFIAPFALSIGSATLFVEKILYELFGMATPPYSLSTSLYIVIGIFVALADDLGRFVNHWLHHRIPFLWNIHKVHHSATVLTPMTLYRVHPIELFLHGSIAGLFSGIVFGTARYLTNGELSLLTILNTNVIVFFAALIGSNLRHSHIFIRYPDWISKVLMSPAQHQVHHSKRKVHHDKNLGSALSVWDWLCGTLYIPKRGEELEFGVEDSHHFSTIHQLYLTSLAQSFPFQKAQDKEIKEERAKV